MRIEKKLAQGHLIRCECDRVFIVRTLGPSVECPHCGLTALSTELASAFHQRREAARQEAVKAAAEA